MFRFYGADDTPGAGDSYSGTLATRPVDGCDRDAFGTLLDGADRSHHGRASGAVVKPSPSTHNTTQIGASSLKPRGLPYPRRLRTSRPQLPHWAWHSGALAPPLRALIRHQDHRRVRLS